MNARADQNESRHRFPVVAVCERCGRLFYRTPGKFCDVPACQGWVHHIDRTRLASDEGER